MYTNRKLTVQYRPQNLYDHFLAFMAVNNTSGYLPESEGVDINIPIKDIINTYLKNSVTTLSHFEGVALEIKNRIEEPSKIVLKNIGDIFHLISTCLGYKSLKELIMENKLINEKNELLFDKEFPNKKYKKISSEEIAINKSNNNNVYLQLLNFANNLKLKKVYQNTLNETEQILFYFYSLKNTTVKEIKTKGSVIKTIHGKTLKLTEIYDLISIVLGYMSYEALYNYKVEKITNIIPNKINS